MTPQELRECLILEADGKKVKVSIENPNWKHVLIVITLTIAVVAMVFLH